MPYPLRPSGTPLLTTVKILSGAAISAVADLGGYNLYQILMPDDWTTANLTVQVSYDNSTYYDLYTSGGDEYTIDAAQAVAIAIPPDNLSSVRYIKIRSGTGGSPVNQDDDRIITLVLANNQ